MMLFMGFEHVVVEVWKKSADLGYITSFSTYVCTVSSSIMCLTSLPFFLAALSPLDRTRFGGHPA